MKVKKTPNVQAEGTDIIFLLFLIFLGQIPIGELDNINSNGIILDFCQKIADFQLTDLFQHFKSRSHFSESLNDDY